MNIIVPELLLESSCKKHSTTSSMSQCCLDSGSCIKEENCLWAIRSNWTDRSFRIHWINWTTGLQGIMGFTGSTGTTRNTRQYRTYWVSFIELWLCRSNEKYITTIHWYRIHCLHLNPLFTQADVLFWD